MLQKKFVDDVGGDDVMFDISDKGADELQMLDILLDQELVVDVIADAVGIFFEEEFIVRIQVVCGIYFQYAEDIVLCFKGELIYEH